jgi:hypothetical protein
MWEGGGRREEGEGRREEGGRRTEEGGGRREEGGGREMIALSEGEQRRIERVKPLKIGKLNFENSFVATTTLGLPSSSLPPLPPPF